MDNTLAIAIGQHRIQRLMLATAAATALLLLAACGGSEAETPPQAGDSSSSTSIAPTGSNSGDGVVASTDDGQTGSATSTDSNTTADTSGSTGNVTEIITPAQQYLAATEALFLAVDSTSDSVATQLENADVESEVWRTETAATLRELAAVLDGAGDLTVPPEYATQHQLLVDATSKYSWATEMLADGVETLDLTTISDAAALLANASVELATAQASLTS